VSLAVRLRRIGFRLAYRGLQVVWFLRRPETRGVKCLLTSCEHVLLVRHTYGRRVWDLPGGGVKTGEDPVDAARREMAEELGITGAHWHPAGMIRGQEAFRTDTIHCFRAELADRTVTPNPGELAAARWFGQRELPADLARYAGAVLEAQLPL
jgi:8-oxo-dGTP pyrophosphatase MutT (NUDIX family)